MKQLLLMRHAKSDQNVTGLKDFDRPLNNRGFRAAPKMGGIIFETGFVPDVIYTSPALRTKTTAELVAEQLKYDQGNIVEVEELYEASLRIVLNFVNSIDNNINKAAIIGHNPTFTYIAEYFTGDVFNNIPTGGAILITFDTDDWRTVSKDTGTTVWFRYPKEDEEAEG